MSILPDWNSIESTARWSDILFWAGIVFLVLLAATEVASHIYGSRSANLNSEAIRIDEENRKEAEEEAERQRATDRARFNAQAARAAQLRQQLANAEELAAKAVDEAAVVERQTAPRHLTVPQGQTIFNAIAPFRGNKVDITVPMGDSEAMSFAGEFIALFQKAGWDAGTNYGINQAVYSGPPVFGIQVTVNELEAKAGRLPVGAEPLIHALVAAGLTKGAFANLQTAPGKIDLRIGPKAPE